MLIDTHTHVVSDDPSRFPLDPGMPASWYIDAPVAVERFVHLMDEADVDRAVLVQGFGPYKYDNRYVTDSGLRYPDRFSTVCVVGYENDSVERLTYWVKERGVRGVRVFASGRAGGSEWLEDESSDALWRCAIGLGIPIVVQLMSAHIPGLHRVMERFPDTPLLLDHCGFPDLSGGPPYEKAQGLFDLASFPQVHLKVTSNVLTPAGADGGDPRNFVERLVATFGADKLMWGSDYCQTYDRPYAELVELGRAACSSLSPEEQTWFQGETALKFWPELRGKPKPA